MSPVSQRPRRPMNPIPVEDRPLGPLQGVPPSRRQQAFDRGFGAGQKARAFVSRNALPLAAGAAAVGGAGYLIHRSRQKKDAMSKNLVNPFEEVVVFGKAYPVALPVPSSTTIRALVPTGGHVGHGNDLKVVRNRKGKGGPATKLEHYRGGRAKQSMGPFGKALSFSQPGMMTAAKVAASGKGSPSVGRGLGMVANMKAPSRVPMAGQTPLRVRRARAAQGPVSFQNPGSRGSRLA